MLWSARPEQYSGGRKGVGIEPVVLVWDTLGGVSDSGDDGVSQPCGKGMVERVNNVQPIRGVR